MERNADKGIPSVVRLNFEDIPVEFSGVESWPTAGQEDCLTEFQKYPRSEGKNQEIIIANSSLSFKNLFTK